jgi:hypothetical protein
MNNYKTLSINGVNNNAAIASRIKKLTNDLNAFHAKLPTQYSEILNIRDEIVADLDKFLYLLTLK